MKSIFFATVFALILPMVGFSVDETLETRLQRGLFEEEANHNLDAAKKQYEQIIANFDVEQKLVGTAILHMAQALRKEGKTNEAQVYFQRILRDFSSNVELVASAALALGVTNSPVVSTKRTWIKPGTIILTGRALGKSFVVIEFPMEAPPTLSQAVQKHVDQYAKLSKVKVTRDGRDIVINVEEILSGKQPDFLLQDGDRVELMDKFFNLF